VKVVLVALDDPWLRSHGGTQRTRLFLRSLLALGHQVVCVYAAGPEPAARPSADGLTAVPVPSMPAGERALPDWVKRLKRELLPIPTTLGARSRSLAAAVAAQAPADVVLVQQLRAAPYRAELADARLWLDQVDLWSALADGEVAARSGVARAAARAQRAQLRRAERRLAGDADLLTAAGYGDAERLEDMAGRPVRWLPNAARLPDEGIPAAPRTRRAGLLANFGFWPNRDAFELLRATWLPRLRAAGWTAVVAGHGSERLAGEAGLDVLGPVEHPRDFYARVDVTLAPIRRGGGIKVKVLESLLYGRPVVATDKALDGFSPAIRALIPTVDGDRPGLEAVLRDDLAVDRRLEPLLEPCTEAGFRRAVGDALQGVDGAVR
jgi:hypothetical protein